MIITYICIFTFYFILLIEIMKSIYRMLTIKKELKQFEADYEKLFEAIIELEQNGKHD